MLLPEIEIEAPTYTPEPVQGPAQPADESVVPADAGAPPGGTPEDLPDAPVDEGTYLGEIDENGNWVVTSPQDLPDAPVDEGTYLGEIDENGNWVAAPVDEGPPTDLPLLEFAIPSSVADAPDAPPEEYPGLGADDTLGVEDYGDSGGPDDSGPDDSGGDDGAPETGPDDSGPDDSGGDDGAPETGPDDSGPDDSGGDEGIPAVADDAGIPAVAGSDEGIPAVADDAGNVGGGGDVDAGNLEAGMRAMAQARAEYWLKRRLQAPHDG